MLGEKSCVPRPFNDDVFKGERRRITGEDNMIRGSSLIFVFLLFNALSVCQTQHPGERGYNEISKIAQSEAGERLRRFSAYPVDQQIDIYLYSQYSVEGGSDEFFRFLAKDGESKIPAILKRMDADADRDPRAKIGLIRVLDFIDQGCLCLAKIDSSFDVLERVEMKINATDGQGFKGFKELYDQIFETIKRRDRTTEP